MVLDNNLKTDNAKGPTSLRAQCLYVLEQGKKMIGLCWLEWKYDFTISCLTWPKQSLAEGSGGLAWWYISDIQSTFMRCFFFQTSTTVAKAFSKQSIIMSNICKTQKQNRGCIRIKDLRSFYDTKFICARKKYITVEQ